MANLRIARAQQEEALAEFRGVVLKAASEVNDALAAWQHADRRLQLCRRQRKKLQRTVNSTKLLMTYSTASSYLEVLTAQQTLLQAELTEIKEIQACLQGVTALYRAMGDIFIRL